MNEEKNKKEQDSSIIDNTLETLTEFSVEVCSTIGKGTECLGDIVGDIVSSL